MRLWRRIRGSVEGSPECSEDTARRRVVYTQAQERLEAVEARADVAVRSILARHARNHWTEAIRAVVKED